jgi:hypothetical protein
LCESEPFFQGFLAFQLLGNQANYGGALYIAASQVATLEGSIGFLILGLTVSRAILLSNWNFFTLYSILSAFLQQKPYDGEVSLEVTPSRSLA